ncbi:MAG: DnaJ domain-containing protein [Desulfobacteraceae bacterium]|nr:DnaJ domain-containing protein [Desulfobacteraceae bacterium]
MDIKQALAILNLKSDACLEDAKNSFRSLAKKYHPDKLSLNNKAPTGHDKMQEINLAFHLLKTNLKPKKVLKQKQKAKKQTEHRAKDSSVPINFTALFKKIYKSFFKSAKFKVRQKKEGPSTKFKSTNRSSGSKNNKKKEKPFDSILNKTIKSHIDGNFRKRDTIKSMQKNKLENTYSRYMELKQKMGSKRKFTRVEGSTPIEKISPISPIKKI